MARKKGEQTYNKDSQRRIDDLTQQNALQTNLAAGLEKLIKGQSGSADAAEKITERMLKQNDAAGKLKVILEEKQKIIEGHYELNKVQQALLLKTLETSEKIATVDIKRKDLSEEITNKTKEANDALLGSLGTMGAMIKAGGGLAAGAALFKGLSEATGNIFKTTIGLASDLNQELGMSGAAGMEAGMMNFSSAAIFSKFSIADLNQATKDFATTMGTTAGLTNDLRNSMAAMSKMGVGGEDAAKMAQSMESAGGSANDMTEEISTMAQDSGVLASVTFKDMASQQKLMVGMSEKEIKLLAQKTIAMNKQGRSLSDMRGIADNMLDIESSMKAQAKARIMLGDKLTATQMEGMQGMTAAAMEFMNTGNTDALNAALDKANMSTEAFNELGPRGMDIYAASIGMTSDLLAEQIQKREQAKKIEESSDLDKGLATALDLYQRTPDAIKEGTTALIGYIAQMGIMNLMQGKAAGKGIGGTIKGFFGKGGGGGASSEVSTPKGKKGPSPVNSITKSLGKMDMKKVLQGAAALVVVAAAVFVFGKAVQEFMGVSWEAVGMAVVSMLALVGAVALLGAIMSSGVGAVAIIAGAAAMVIVAAAMLVLGYAIQEIAKGFEMMGNLTESLMGLITIGPMLMPLSAVLGLFGLGIAALGIGLLMAVPGILAFGLASMVLVTAVPAISALATGLDTMMSAVTMENVGAMLLLGPALMGVAFGLAAIGMMGVPGLLALTGLGAVTVLLAPTLMGIADSIGDMMGGGSDDTDSNSDNSDSKLIDAINGLRGDIQSQPILISVDGKVVSEITKIQSRQGVSKNVYRK